MASTKTDKPTTAISGPYKKGQSGNLKGRPKGAKSKKTLLQEVLINDAQDIMVKHFPKIVEAVVERAKQGDMVAARMVMDRLIPAKKAVEVTGKGGGDFGIKIIVEQIKQEAIHAIEADDESDIIEGEIINDKD